MEVGLPSGAPEYRPPPPPPRLHASSSSTPALHSSTPTTPNKHVNFNHSPQGEKKREKFLTAKYGAHQMALIRKRLRVEMWMYDQLQALYASTADEPVQDVEIDLDEVLDLEDDTKRKQFIRDLLINSTSSRENINKFVDDLLEKAKTL